MPLAVYVCYVFYVIYTGFYLYNRVNGKSAQFFTARVLPTNSTEFKLFADICVGLAFLIAFFGMLYKVFIQ